MPEEQVPFTQEAPTAIRKPKRPCLKIVLISVLALIFTGSLVFAGYFFGKKSNLKTQISKPQLKTQNLTSNPTVATNPTPTPDPTINWKTHINTKYGYQFSHPPKWSFKTVFIHEETKPLYVIRETISSGDINGYTVLIQAYDNPNKLSLVDWLRYKRDSNALTLPTEDMELV